jgi:LAO/AO transport system ATPase
MLMPQGTAQRVVLAKVGLDGHDRGIRIVSRGLREAGFHVIYAGMWQSPAAVVQTVLDEDADWLGLSLLSGAHMTLVPRVLDLLREKGLADVGVVLGGIIPADDAAKLKALGVAAIFGPGTPIPEIVGEMQNRTRPEQSLDLRQRFHQKDRRALSQLLSVVTRLPATESPTPELLGTGDRNHPARGRVVALSGSGGVGKSSLIGRLVEYLREQGRTVAVLCCDPESSVTGGALLGDRTRIAKPTEDEGLFIRSLAARAGQQAIVPHLDSMADLLIEFGFETVILETVGAGQGDTAVKELADVLVVLLQPETGDELQWEKAGLLEVADVVVVNKADLPGAAAVHSQVRELLNLPGYRAVPVLKASAAKREGLGELWETLQSIPPRPRRATP